MLDSHELLEQCRDGDLDACREISSRHAPSMLRVAYLLTGSRDWSIELVSQTLIGVFGSLNRVRFPGSFEHWSLYTLLNEWREQNSVAWEVPHRPVRQPDAIAGHDPDQSRERVRAALARLDDHQRAVIAVHIFGGLPLERVADALDVPAEMLYAQLVRCRAHLVIAARLQAQETLPVLLNGIAMNAPRIAVWPGIEREVDALLSARTRRQRLISASVIAGVAVSLVLGVFMIAGSSSGGGQSPTPAAGLAAATSTPGAAFTILPTATPTPRPDVSDTIVFSSRVSDANRTWLFDRRLEHVPLLGEDIREAGSPVVAPDGSQVYLLWYEFEGTRATGYVAAYDDDLASELWRAEIAVDEDVPSGDSIDFRMSVAVDHERVYVAVQAWRSSDLVEIEVRSRADGVLSETIQTTLAGFAAHDIRLHSPPGSNRVSLFAITSDAPPESGGLQITFLSYTVPGGEKVHGRILFDQPDSRSFFLYGSQMIAGSDTLFGVEHTEYYQQLAVHLFDLGQGTLEPRRVIPFQPVANPLPYQQAVSHDGHWLYVLSTASLEVAVFDLFEKTLAGIVPLDPGVLANSEIGVSYPRGRSMQISPDGRWVYAEGTLDGQASGIWVIDALSWTIVDHWMPGSRPAEILLSGDGGTLYARIERSSDPAELVAIDTSTGLAELVALPDDGRFSLASIATLFQHTYASSPAIDGRMPDSPASTEPLAAASIAVSPSTASPGSMFAIEVRFVHPITGKAVDRNADGTRFQPPDSVRAIWTPDNGHSPLILELGQVEYGHYQGRGQLDEQGDWSLRLDIDWPDGSIADRTLVYQGSVRIIPAVSADGPSLDQAPSG